ncbi:RNA methyltransferase, RsmE family [Marinospirillum celere]|uniref:Ribosomal RNA small subunit methyltransferase E n=1 Tax=Marinospirillum celere TaxID=1122252 RepID=A0A1I1FPZ4_9GAMM|nr:16S rRNA (uracil(1498)-N(3))-methyltransferase [Marinospirillum celere]SFB99153.1 RNA methyltransferase, RsmE family [Marinospirillum celere]
MNLLLVDPLELNDNQQIRLTGRRHQHLRDIHKLQPGDQLKAGVLNGLAGTATLLELEQDSSLLALDVHSQPPAPLPVTLILALPRPRMLARSLEHLATLGVKNIHLLQTAKVEKSYWQSPELRPEKVHQHLLLGLEQARDTLLPTVELHQRFRPFVEDLLPEISRDTYKLVAHPGDYPACPRGLEEPTTLAIGPEGGFVDFEIEKLVEQGFQPVQIGERILRVETAVTALLAKLF